MKCKYCESERKNKNSLAQHERRCPHNPDRLDTSGSNNGMYGKRGSNKFIKDPNAKTSDETKKKLSIAHKGRKHSEEFKKKISESMKRAHANGKAWNIGMSRWNNEPSWPEKFFMQAIENEFGDKKYTREFPVGIFSCDFAWVHKKKCIEIDGEQHQRHQEVKDRDERKNQKLLAEGWQVMRIPWSEMYNDTKTWIQLANKFVSE
jgi:very-short-patch-repair endonuclease